MAYTLKEIFEALGKIENGSAMVADLQDVISQVRQEVASNRVARNKVLDALGLSIVPVWNGCTAKNLNKHEKKTSKIR